MQPIPTTEDNDNIEMTDFGTDLVLPLKSRNKNRVIIVLGLCLAIVLVASVVSILILINLIKKSETSDEERSPRSWRDDVCSVGKCPQNWPTPLPVLLVSLDGFRAEYLTGLFTPSMRRLIQCASHTPFMYSVYPTKTFVNHYTIATGLYPESHGIIDNAFYDPKLNESFKKIVAPRFWGGEPLWRTAQRNGMKSAAFFWPGSDIGGQFPNYYETYRGGVSLVTQLKRIFEWLAMPPEERPHYITVYINPPDNAGHLFGPKSDQVNDDLLLVDSLINHLMQELHSRSLLHCINVIFLSDHGMQEQNHEVIRTDFFVSNDQVRAFQGPVGRLMLRPNSTFDRDSLHEKFRCQNSSVFRSYSKGIDMPRRLHYTRNRRIGDVIIDSNAGYYVSNSNETYTENGNHGYDYRLKSMHAIFMGFGPNFKRNFTTEPFENIEIFDLVADLLEFDERPATNGTAGALRHLLVDKPDATQPVHVPSHNYTLCPNRQQLLCPKTTVESSCTTATKISALQLTSVQRNDQWCMYNQCGYTILYDNVVGMPVAVQSSVLLSAQLQVFQYHVNYWFENNNRNCDTIENHLGILKSRDMSLFPLAGFAQDQVSNFYGQKIPLYTAFGNEQYRWALEHVINCTKKFNRLLVISGPAFDYDNDGLFDSVKLIRNNSLNGIAVSSHVYWILVRCDGAWTADGLSCMNAASAQVQSFVLPNIPVPSICTGSAEYLYQYTAKVRDIEHLTGLLFFNDMSRWTKRHSLRLRLHINQELW